MGASESKHKKWKGGNLYIELADGQQNVVAGQVISGVVHVYLEQTSFPVKELTIGLYGAEKVKFRLSEHPDFEYQRESSYENGSKCKGEAESIKMVFPIWTPPHSEIPEQQLSIPFTMQLPDWLPPSAMFASGCLDRALFRQKYSLKAQMIPLYD